MAWPAGQQNGRFAYRDLTPAQTGVPAGTVIASTAESSIFVPWGSQGFRQAQAYFSLAAPAGGSDVSFRATPYDSDGNAMFKQEIILPSLALTVGTWQIMFTWNDGPLPGNWNLISPGGAVTTGGNCLNPAWAGSATLILLGIKNNSANTLTVNNFRILLRG